MKTACMLSLDEARDMASGIWDGFDNYSEYDNCFVFGKSDDESDGGEGPVVILKESGRAVNFVWALVNGMFGDVEENGLKEPIPLGE